MQRFMDSHGVVLGASSGPQGHWCILQLFRSMLLGLSLQRVRVTGLVMFSLVALAGAMEGGPADAKDFASDSSAGDAKTAAAIRKDANFVCPASAATAGAARKGLRSRKLQVSTTVAPITSIVANVAGERADVHGVIPEGEDRPHQRAEAERG